VNRLIRNSRGVGKVTLTFTSVIVVLFIAIIALGFVMSNRIDTLQTANNSLQSQVSSLQNNLNNLQSQYDQLNSAYQQLQSSNTSSQTSQIASLQNQIASLQSQLLNATAIIAQLQGQTGILPVYMDLGYAGSYYLQLSLKNTGTSPITQVFVTLNSVQIPMTFTYLNATVNADTPLPSYQTATGRQNVSPPIMQLGTYPLIIQAIATNGTVYNYQTTITAHI
jgi:multidrug efflux pump subunit AcrA (membrane-fusion protein)